MSEKTEKMTKAKIERTKKLKQENPDKQICWGCNRIKEDCICGRPTKYDPKYCKMIIDYFNVEAYTEKQTMTSTNEKTGEEKEYTKTRPTDFPTIEWFAASIDVNDSTLEDRSKKYKEFYLAYSKARQLQKKILIINWMNWLYKEWFAKFVAINCFPDMKDKSERNITLELDPEDEAKVDELLDMND